MAMTMVMATAGYGNGYGYGYGYGFFLSARTNLRVLGSPNPGQSFGRGLSDPQSTDVSRDPGGSWAATNLTVHLSNSFLGPSFFQGASGSYSWVAFLDVFQFFGVFKPEEGTWIQVVSWRTQLWKIPWWSNFFFLPDATDVFPCIACGAMHAPSV